MKRHLIYLAFIFAAATVIELLFSCSISGGQTSQLEKIKELGDKDPQTALAKLDSLSSHIANESRHTMMRYKLLELRLQDKAYITPSSDTKAKELYTYFMDNGNEVEKQEACYYLASVYRDLHDSPRATEFFLQSLGIAESSEGIDSIILTNTCSQLSSLYRIHYDYESAMEMAQKGLGIARKLNIVDPIYIMDVATIAFVMTDTAKIRQYQKEALKLVLQEESENEYADAVCEILSNYSILHLTEEATECRPLLDRIKETNRPHNYFSSLGAFYHSIGDMDSAIYYFEILYNEEPDLVQKSYASKMLTQLYANKGNISLSNKYALKFIEIESEYRKLLAHERTVNEHNEFIYNRDRAQEAEVYKEAQEVKTQRLYWVLAFILLTAVSFTIFQRMKYRNLKRANRDLRVINEMERVIKENKQIIKEKEEHIRDQKQRIKKSQEQLNFLVNDLEDKEQRIISKDTELEKAERLLQEKEKTLIEKLEQNEKLFKFAFMENLTQKANEVLEKFRKAAKGTHRLSDEEWKQLYSAIEELYPQFKKAVMQKIKKPSEDKLRISYLLKAGMTKPQIINLTGYPTTTVWRKVKYITETLGEELLSLDIT